jgi:hypothetical protein
MWPCIAESPVLKPLVIGDGAVGLYRRLQHIEVATPAGIAPRAVGDVVPLDPREVSLLLRIEQGGDIVHSSVHALSAVLGEEVICSISSEHLAGLAFDFGDAPALVCRQHERFPNTISITLCAVRSDGLVASVMPTTLLNRISAIYPFGPTGDHQYAANPALEGFAQDPLLLSFIDALVEAQEEVQEYRLIGGGPMTVTIRKDIHLGHFAPSQDDSTPFAERHHVQADGSFSVLDGIRICPEGVLIQRLGITFSLLIRGSCNNHFLKSVDLPLIDGVQMLLNELLVFS